MPGERASDLGYRPEDFESRVLCICLACGKGGVFEVSPPEAPLSLTRAWRFRCRSCAATGSGKTGSSPAYAALGYRRLLETETRHGTLRFHNLEELDYVAAFLDAKLREKAFIPPTGDKDRPGGHRVRSTGSVLSKLPGWVKSGKNRDEIARAIRRLREIAATVT